MGVKTRFLIISDTHGEDVPLAHHQPADVAIHCGDLTEESKINEFCHTLQLLKSLKAPLKIIIPGNHDFTMDLPTFKSNIDGADEPLDPLLVKREFGDYGELHQIFSEAKSEGIHVLEEGTHQFQLGNGALLTVYASPFTPSPHNSWGFHYLPTQHEFAIPETADVVITHGPPHGIMDITGSRKRIGCPNLFGAVARAQPKLHCFGHVHSGWGAKLVTWREKIREVPSHFQDVNNDNSIVIENLSTLKSTKFDTTEEVEAKTEKRKLLDHQGYLGTSHCTDDELSLKRGQTLFVNAAIQGTAEDYPMHLPWLVDMELPPTPNLRDSTKMKETVKSVILVKKE